MRKDNTNEHTQFELFDESHNIFEVIEQAEKTQSVCAVCGEPTKPPFIPYCCDCELDMENMAGSFKNTFVSNYLRRKI